MKIYSINLITWLKVNGLDFKKLSYNEKKQKVYALYDSNDQLLHQLIEEYRSNESLINLKTYIIQFSTVKLEINQVLEKFKKQDFRYS
ncbi:DUF5659 domain-containing protein [Bacillus sp. AFS017336]|uniref:DUF5659 domain-containing protein n=1 Tax=Bacillus sp. AFS017336 TaxID=2033489 RepID=UPI000BF2458B|nr:DUF5659 domain-containing protein [Bacillus sp. AFS017336]PEL13778.1 hypothetical protein CN601_03435 [Bacillus sp. AFS017336]